MGRYFATFDLLGSAFLAYCVVCPFYLSFTKKPSFLAMVVISLPLTLGIAACLAMFAAGD